MRQRRLHRDLVDDRHVPLGVEGDADVALDPRERIFLPDRDQHFVAVDALIRLAGRHELAAAFRVVDRGDFLEHHAGELAVLVHECLRHEIVEDRDAFVHRILFLPGRCLHFLESRAHDDFHVIAAEPPRGAAAIHRRVAAAEHDHALADFFDVAEIHRCQPVDADMDLRRGFRATGKLQIASARRAAADEHGVVVFGEHRFHRIDAPAADEFDAEIEDVAGFLVDDFFGQAKARHLRAHETAGFCVGFEHGDVIAERNEIARDGERRRTGADAGDALTVLLRRGFRQPVADVVLEIGGDALQAADRDGLGFRILVVRLDAAAPAGRLARAIAGASEDSGKDIRFPVDQIRVGIPAGGDQADVFGNRGMGRAGPLAIDDFVEISGITDIGGLHLSLLAETRRATREPSPCAIAAERRGAACWWREIPSFQQFSSRFPSPARGRGLG